jgi:hypothetical protein
MSAADEVTIAGLPLPLRWLRTPRSWEATGSQLTIEAGAETDWFADPGDPAHLLASAPALLAPASGDFLLSARVTVAFASSDDPSVTTETIVGSDRGEYSRQSLAQRRSST